MPRSWAIFASVFIWACQAGPDQMAVEKALRELACPQGSRPAECPLWYGRAACCLSGDDRRQGPWLAFWRNGQLHERGRYCNQKACGDWQRFDPFGHQTEFGAYGDGKRHGRWVFYFKASSQERERGDFLAGVRSGLWRHFDQSGNLVGQGRYHSDQRDGPWITRDQDGHRCAGSYQAGLKSGRWTCYHVEHPETRWTEGDYLSGQEQGVWRVWYTHGGLKRQGEYRLGKRHGRWLDYDQKGVLIGEYEYQDDRMVRSRRTRP